MRAGSSQLIEADFLAPGQTVCFSRYSSKAGTTADQDGHASTTVPLRAGSGTRVYDVATSEGVLATYSFEALAAKTLPVKRKKRVEAGGKQRVVVTGLADGESVRVFYRGKRVADGIANDKHRFVARFKAGRKAGVQKVRVVGEFGNRTATKSFRVIKG